MAANSAQEQLMLELINRARMNPAAEAARQGITLNQGLAPGTISTAPKQVLAMNDFLVLSADRHSNWMLVNDVFNHNETAGTSGFTGVTPSSRMTAAGYVFAGPAFSSGENISWTGTTGTLNATTAIIAQHRSLFLSAGHRTNMLDDDFREAGIGQQLGVFTSGGTNYNASMVTQNYRAERHQDLCHRRHLQRHRGQRQFLQRRRADPRPGRQRDRELPTPPGPVAAMSSPLRPAAPRPSASAWRPA